MDEKRMTTYRYQDLPELYERHATLTDVLAGLEEEKKLGEW